MKAHESTITFVGSSSVLDPIAQEFKKAGYDTEFRSLSSTIQNPPKVGIYCNHAYPDCRVTAENSVGIINSVDDGCLAEYFWREQWNRFDMGLLLGEASAEVWRSASWCKYARPKGGVYRGGWPKSDWAYTDDFKNTVQETRDNLELRSGRTVVYAPCEESEQKMFDFLQSVDGVADNLLLRHKKTHQKNIDFSKIKTDTYDSNVVILDGDLDIFTALQLGDILVSEQSGVLLDSLHVGTIPISVTDWPVNLPVGKQYPGPALPEFVKRTTKDNLSTAVEECYLEQENIDLEKSRNRHFDNVGESAEAYFDIIETVLLKNEAHPSLVETSGKVPTASFSEKAFAFTRVNIEKRLPAKTKKQLVNLGASNVLNKIKNVVVHDS